MNLKTKLILWLLICKNIKSVGQLVDILGYNLGVEYFDLNKKYKKRSPYLVIRYIDEYAKVFDRIDESEQIMHLLNTAVKYSSGTLISQKSAEYDDVSIPAEKSFWFNKLLLDFAALGVK